jgi:hypothetical protein
LLIAIGVTEAAHSNGEIYGHISEPSSNHKKDSSDFAFSYNRKIYFMVVKIYFYTYVPRFGSSIGFLCRNFN